MMNYKKPPSAEFLCISEHLVAGRPVDVDDEAHPAGVLLLRRVVQTLRLVNQFNQFFNHSIQFNYYFSCSRMVDRDWVNYFFLNIFLLLPRAVSSLSRQKALYHVVAKCLRRIREFWNIVRWWNLPWLTLRYISVALLYSHIQWQHNCLLRFSNCRLNFPT